jgi:hypothetical protein
MNRLADLIEEISPIFDTLIFSEGFVYRTPSGDLALLAMNNSEREYLKRWWQEMKALGEVQ